ncbi:hypothetical protein DPX16_18174 [Anabarilius grahami]|uniref:Uncharacterized protein n=1 Tax=Anabarilius grahami TaxID=495550 RepID=A0A3N0YNX7_ANAGA|nr:hypothetical protein DPX16_18174 [Anabarilius grahami]
MANQADTGQADHEYNMSALMEACDKEEVEAMMEETPKARHEHTPMPSPNPKKRFDEQDQRLKIIEKRMEENAHAVKENKEVIGRMKEEIMDLRKENISLKQQCLEQARYKRRWDLRLIGLPEKEKEDTREVVIGIFTRVKTPGVGGYSASFGKEE